VVNELTW